MAEAQARKEEDQRAKQREGLEFVARAQREVAEDREKAAERRRRWRADHKGEMFGVGLVVWFGHLCVDLIAL